MPPERIITDRLRSYAEPSATSSRLSSTDPTEGSTTEQKIPTCHCENENVRCRVFGQPQRFVSIFSALRNLFVTPSLLRQ
jgi:putative transposase